MVEEHRIRDCRKQCLTNVSILQKTLICEASSLLMIVGCVVDSVRYFM